jgi:hypothetical protein
MPSSNFSSLPPDAARLDGWEARLAVLFKDAHQKPYVLGQHDCFSFACAAVLALTGVDLWSQWAGAYSDRRGALRAIATYGGNFTDAASKLFGSAPVPMHRAMRGDICEYRDREGEKHLGVVDGSHCTVLGEHRVGTLPRSDFEHAWRIG